MIKKNIIFCILVLFTLPSWTQDTVTPTIQIDSTQVVLKKFDNSFKEKYTAKKYQYNIAEGEAENLVARAIDWFFKKIGALFGIDIDPGTYVILRYIIYGILVVFAVYIVAKLLIGDNATSFFTKKSKALASIKIEEEHIEQIDIESHIKAALKEKKFRLVIRYMYLKTLKNLSSKNLIDWHFDKTNHDYYREIEDTSIKENFRIISYVYEYVWYGEFAISEEKFIQAKVDFERMQNQIQNAG